MRQTALRWTRLQAPVGLVGPVDEPQLGSRQLPRCGAPGSRCHVTLVCRLS